jgi:hypothetical protein
MNTANYSTTLVFLWKYCRVWGEMAELSSPRLHNGLRQEERCQDRFSDIVPSIYFPLTAYSLHISLPRIYKKINFFFSIIKLQLTLPIVQLHLTLYISGVGFVLDTRYVNGRHSIQMGPQTVPANPFSKLPYKLNWTAYWNMPNVISLSSFLSSWSIRPYIASSLLL